MRDPLCVIVQTASGAVPDSAKRHVYACCVAHLYERFVEGVGRVRKCSTAGRGQMAMDITFVDQYVQKVFALPYVCVLTLWLLALFCLPSLVVHLTSQVVSMFMYMFLCNVALLPLCLGQQ